MSCVGFRAEHALWRALAVFMDASQAFNRSAGFFRLAVAAAAFI
jgi:hypothetical protein